MDIFLIRHALAEERSLFQLKKLSDSMRPLTKKGRDKFKNKAEKLKTIIGDVDLIISSSYLRARQTAEIISDLYPNIKIMTSPDLVPSSNPQDFANWSAKYIQKKIKRIIIVGHEPQLSVFASWLLFGSQQSRIQIKKGGCIAIKVNKLMTKNNGILKWAITSKII